MGRHNATDFPLMITSIYSLILSSIYHSTTECVEYVGRYIEVAPSGSVRKPATVCWCTELDCCDR